MNTIDGARKNYEAAKTLQNIGLSSTKASEILGLSRATVKLYFRADSFDDFRERNRAYRKNREQGSTRGLSPAAELPIFKAAEAISEAEKQNEMIMSRLELLGTPYEISLLAKVAEKMGIQNKATINAT